VRAADERSYWDRAAPHYDRTAVVWGGPMPGMLERVRAALRGAGEVLEVAAGTGLVTVAIAAEARHVLATDYSAPMVERLAARVAAAGLTNVTCARADLYALDLAPGRFDAVVAANVLHLVPDLPAALAALVRVLRPGGLLVVPTFCHHETLVARSLSRLFYLTGFPSRRRFTVQGLGDAVARTGLEVVRLERIPGLFPIGHCEARRPA